MRMQKHNNWLVISALMFAFLACSSVGQNTDTDVVYTTHSLLHDGIERTYLVVHPGGESSRPLALILALHGGGGTAHSMCAMPGGLAWPAQREGYLLVCPEGFDRHWNDGREIQVWRAHAEGIDDVGFLMGLIDELEQQFPIDEGRIFASGISNGGQMSYRLACEESERIRAIAPVAASMPTTLECIPTHPISVLVINGTEDPLVPYEGGEIQVLRRGLGTVRPTSEVVQFWAGHNDCEGDAERSLESDRSPTDGTRVWRLEHENCSSEVQVVVYEVEGGGHTWPGANLYLPRFVIGRLSRDIQASEAIIDFFAGTHPSSEH